MTRQPGDIGRHQRERGDTLFEGGQGRSGQEVEDSVLLIAKALCVLALALGLTWGLAGLVAITAWACRFAGLAQ